MGTPTQPSAIILIGHSQGGRVAGPYYFMASRWVGGGTKGEHKSIKLIHLLSTYSTVRPLLAVGSLRALCLRNKDIKNRSLLCQRGTYVTRPSIGWLVRELLDIPLNHHLE